MAPAKKEYDNVSTVSQAVVKVTALIVLCIILYIDANNAQFEAKDIELVLAGYVAGAEAMSVYRKVKGQ